MVKVIFETKRERNDAVNVLERCVELRLQHIDSVKRKKTWRPAEQAMAIADFQRDIDVLRILIVGVEMMPVEGVEDKKMGGL